jgi:hypothetical protein
MIEGLSFIGAHIQRFFLPAMKPISALHNLPSSQFPNLLQQAFQLD